MAGLSDHLRGVESEAPAEKSEEVVEKTDDEDRSWKEVRGELIRKQEKDKADLVAMLNDLSRKMDQQNQARPTDSPQPTSVAGKKLEDMSTSELQTFRNTVDWEKVSEADKVQFELLVAGKQIEDRVEVKLTTFQQKQQLEQEQQKYAHQAVERYPDLKNAGSDLAREVDARLQAMSPEVLAVNPRAVLDLANEVAIARNISPQTRRVQSLTKPAGTRTGPAEDAEELPTGMSSNEQREALAKRFQHALPKGSKFDLDEIAKEEAEIRKNMDLHTNG